MDVCVYVDVCVCMYTVTFLELLGQYQ
ncbi:hypothetical protein TSAR_008614 [Trichomalopsis sarcophagae]|uniref:Uncharacterized protein n=1 Tax=Trichomalopsis sarcophagae TaxID=543379 RepID=A0A232EIA0_9HYME|nr:hypothetical protein TSAR_008614 [Trichomalopsis sarcophagae]